MKEDTKVTKRTTKERVDVSIDLGGTSRVEVLPELECNCSVWIDCEHDYDAADGEYDFIVEELPGCCGVAVLHNLGELAGMALRSGSTTEVQDEVIRQILVGIGKSSVIATDIVRRRGARRDNNNNDYLLRNGFTEVSRFVNSSTGNTIGVFMWVKPKQKRTRR